MSFLARFRALTKILAIVIVMSAITAGVTWLGVSALGTLNTGADNMNKASQRALVALRANLNVLAMSRAEYRVALDARPESRNALHKLVDDQLKLFLERVEVIGQTRDEKARSLLPAVREAVAEYQKDVKITFGIADGVTDVQTSEQTERMRDAAATSRAAAQKLQAAIGAVADRLSERVDGFSKSAAEEYESSSRLMMIVSAVGTVLALSMGIMIGQFGIAKPMGSLVAVLQRMAKGEDVVITGTERRDEVGETARAVDEIKVMLAEKARQEAEEKIEQDKMLAADREAAAQKMAHEFEAAVGGIVQAAVAGDFSQRVDLHGKTGLVLNVGTSLNSLCQNVAKALGDLIGMLESLADGDLTKRITANYEGNFALLKDNANKTAERIGSTILEIKTATREVTNASTEIGASTTDLSQRTEEQAASLEQTSASMEEIAATVKKNAENAQQVNQSAATTRDVAVRGSEVVASAVTAMAKIEESSGKIADIIGVIDEIARQTNLLALNAAVEAARAGDAGRGFAVVASEVRSLAQRSSQAAKDIKDLITNSTGLVKEGVDLVNRAGTSLDEIVGSIKKVADVVADIAAASVEQSSGIEQVNKALTQMDEVTQQNSALVEENAATAKTLEQQARAMDERVAFFRVEEGGAAGFAAPRAASARPTAKPVAKPAPSRQASRLSAARPQVAGNTALKSDPDWQEF